MKVANLGLSVALAALALSTPASAQQGSTLEKVKQRGFLLCGSGTTAGFSLPDAQGHWSGLDVDLCHAIAAAIFDDPNKVRYIQVSARDRITMLQSGEVDLLSRTTTWTLSRDTSLGIDFGAINYYDGQGFMVRKALNVKQVKDLVGASICTQQGSTTELNLADYFRSQNLKYEVVTFATTEETVKAYEAGRCDAITSDASALAVARLQLSAPAEHLILPELISKEPLASVFRQGDNQWGDVVRWTHFAMITAEELGVTSKNLEDMKKSTSPEIKRLLGSEGNLGNPMGLSNDWAARIVKHVGNYGEVFERNVGAGSKLNIPRGANNLWNQGGLQYAPPFR